MKPSRFLLIATAVLMAFAGCEKEKESNTQAYITLGEEELLVSSFGSTVSVSVQSNYDWECSYSSDWFKVETNKGYLSITYDTNETGVNRKGTITITAVKKSKTIAEAELKITQSSENFDALIFEYTITGNDKTARLPISSVTNANIDWGDGNTEIISSSFPTHKYSIPGVYTVTINGTVKSLKSWDSNFFSNAYGGVTDYLTAVIQWGNTGLTSMKYAFYDCKKLTSLPDGVGPFSNVTSFEGAFHSCSLTEVPTGIFDNCQKVNNFSDVFYGCKFTSVPDGLFSNCPEVTDFSQCFRGCSSLTTVPENIFSNCTKVTNFSYVFSGCSLTTAPENIFSNCTEVTDFSHIFGGCDFTTVPENIFSNCPAVTDFSGAFDGCSLTTVPESIFSKCTKVTNFSKVFLGCPFITVPENIFSDCPAVTDFSYAFSECSSLTTIPTGIFDNSFLVTDFSYTFFNSKSIVGESPYTEIEVDGEKVKVHLYERENYAVEMRWKIPENYKCCFRNSSNFSDHSSIPSDWR